MMKYYSTIYYTIALSTLDSRPCVKVRPCTVYCVPCTRVLVPVYEYIPVYRVPVYPCTRVPVYCNIVIYEYEIRDM